MKKNRSIILISILLGLFSSCQNEKTSDPVFNGLKITSYETGAEIDPANVPVGKQIKIFVNTDADICVLWPGGKRNVLKSKVNIANDSIDTYGHVVLNGLKASDDYRDYSLLGAQGLTTSGSKYSGYSNTYSYPLAGTYSMAILLSNYGISGSEYSRIVVTQNITVK
jgi:hypothetical protein